MLKQIYKNLIKKARLFQFKIGVRDTHLSLLSKSEYYSKSDTNWNTLKAPYSSGIRGWFFDVGGYLSNIGLIELIALEGHIFACFRKV